MDDLTSNNHIERVRQAMENGIKYFENVIHTPLDAILRDDEQNEVTMLHVAASLEDDDRRSFFIDYILTNSGLDVDVTASYLEDCGEGDQSIDGEHRVTGRTPLHVTCICGHEDSMRFLLKAGADPRRRDSLGLCALDLANTYDNYGCVITLLHKQFISIFGSDEQERDLTQCNTNNITSSIPKSDNPKDLGGGDPIEIVTRLLENSSISDAEKLPLPRKSILSGNTREHKTKLDSNANLERTLVQDDFANVTLLEEHYFGVKDISKLSLDPSMISNNVINKGITSMGPPRPPSCSNERKSYHSSVDSLLTSSMRSSCASPVPSLSESTIRDKLIQIGFASPGPITRSTKKFYEKYLRREEKYENTTGSPRARLALSQELNKPLPSYPQEINDLIRGAAAIQYKHLEKLEGRLAVCCSSISGRKNHFNYLLLDPETCHSLPTQVDSNPETLSECFGIFAKAIFYVGKGQGNRSYAHLYEADAARPLGAGDLTTSSRQSVSGKRRSKKITKILQIWDSGRGVVSHHCFHSITSQEALTREALMIAALGKTNLTNVQAGKVKVDLKMNDHTRRLLGTYLLFKAFRTFCIEGVREIRQHQLVNSKK